MTLTRKKVNGENLCCFFFYLSFFFASQPEVETVCAWRCDVEWQMVGRVLMTRLMAEGSLVMKYCFDKYLLPLFPFTLVLFLSLTSCVCVSLYLCVFVCVRVRMCVQLAVCMGTPILTPSWIHQAWQRRDDMWVPPTKLFTSRVSAVTAFTHFTHFPWPFANVSAH